MAISLYDPERPLVLGAGNAEVASLSVVAWTMWQLGYPNQALKRSHEALALAQGLPNPYNLALAKLFVGILHQFRHEARVAQENAESVIAFSTEHGFSEILANATVLRGWAMAQQGRSEEGIAQIQEGLAASRATGAKLWRPYLLCLLAESYAETSRLDDGPGALTEALAATEKHEIRHYEAETHRLKGELLLKQNTAQATEAERCFRVAIETARRQSAKSLELRATTSLARLLASQGRRDEARAMLADIYNWFTEGFDTADLKDAKALLEELSP